jgi:hypothetical protein
MNSVRAVVLCLFFPSLRPSPLVTGNLSLTSASTNFPNPGRPGIYFNLTQPKVLINPLQQFLRIRLDAYLRSIIKMQIISCSEDII